MHEALEGLRRVPQAEGHPQKLEETEGGDDGCLRDVLWGHRDLMVPSYQVYLGEDAFASQVR